MKRSKELELYIHIPFCVQKCNYCDFLSAPATDGTKDAYMEALCRELQEQSSQYKDYEIVTIFIGGGTPTAVAPRSIVKVMEVIRREYSVREHAEITMEMNPGTVTGEALALYREAGINRLSMGLQTTKEQELKTLGRIHSYEDFLRSYQLAREAGFQNINVDIMSALPGQSQESYRQTLQKVAGLTPGPEHISAYSLIVEEGTPFYEASLAGELELPDEETERQMYEDTLDCLEHCGYRRYEISNYAKPGRECKHNLGYWERKDYVGFGLGAASMVNNTRFHNTSDLETYLFQPENAVAERQCLTMEEQMEEMMFLGLRKTEGVSLAEFQQYFHKEMLSVYEEVIEKHLKNGLLMLQERNGEQRLSLTKKGMDVSNYVMADFLEPNLF